MDRLSSPIAPSTATRPNMAAQIITLPRQRWVTQTYAEEIARVCTEQGLACYVPSLEQGPVELQTAKQPIQVPEDVRVLIATIEDSRLIPERIKQARTGRLLILIARNGLNQPMVQTSEDPMTIMLKHGGVQATTRRLKQSLRELRPTLLASA